MLVGALALVTMPSPAIGRGSPIVWRRYEEVFDLRRMADGRIFAATDGGLLRFDHGTWQTEPSPSGLRQFDGSPVSAHLASGRIVRLRIGIAEPRSIERGLVVGPEDHWNASTCGVVDPPPGHVYALLRDSGDLLAGTSDGLWRFHDGRWTREPLPTQMPVSRPNGIARVGDKFVIGGIGGLFLGRPGAWTQLCPDAIRSVSMAGGQVWAVHGSGALDRIDLSTDRYYADILYGSSPRPWTSCVGSAGKTLLFGGEGGWSERAAHGLEGHFSAGLSQDVLLAIAGRDDVRWVATEQSGVLRFAKGDVHRWNPGNGLPDTWVTSLLRTPTGLVVGTMHEGLFVIHGDDIQPLTSPTKRVTQLAEMGGHVVVGGMDGAWIQGRSGWEALPTNGEETTAISVDGRTARVCTAQGIYTLTL